MLTECEKKKMLETMIDDVAEIVRPEVERIEKKLATTKDHYGDYLALMTVDGFARDTRKLLVMSKALIQAGASRQGIASALKIILG